MIPAGARNIRIAFRSAEVSKRSELLRKGKQRYRIENMTKTRKFTSSCALECYVFYFKKYNKRQHFKSKINLRKNFNCFLERHVVIERARHESRFSSGDRAASPEPNQLCFGRIKIQLFSSQVWSFGTGPEGRGNNFGSRTDFGPHCRFGFI
jgi:hypothetical protein